MADFTYRPRGYVHFDFPVKREDAERLVTDPTSVAAHSFFPFIFSVTVTQKIARDEENHVFMRPPKKRAIAYAAHVDSHIFGYFADILSEQYETKVRDRGLQESITAFRKLNGRSNIHFANEVFEFIRQSPSCSAVAMDVTDFFGSLDHAQLKTTWASIIGQERPPVDHFSVFKAITRYCQVDRDALFDALHIPLHNPRLQGPHRLPLLDHNQQRSIPDNANRLCPPHRFREMVRERGLLQINTSGKGIPQGSPISAVLSNIYMLEMDTALHQYVSANGGLYRRYCDDILVVMPTVELRVAVRELIETWLRRLRLEFNPSKTEEIDFGSERPITGKPLQYLGFTFDGSHKRIRPSSVARFYRKMHRGVLRAKYHQAMADIAAGANQPSTLKKKKLYRLYSYLGKSLGKDHEEKRNFLTYAFYASRIMEDPGIKKQVKAHWRRLQDEIQKPLSPATLFRFANRVERENALNDD
ncbi:MAG: reverse transcriptase/maturase family protein [Verrucomicrobia bacterium]|nr:reverse transcriptase/maturase family protein [Verrucomicrobiota bacterium]